MRSFYKIFNIIMMLCLFMSTQLMAAAQGDEKITISSLDGKDAHIVIQKANGSEVTAAIGDELAIGDAIVTDSNGTAELVLGDGSIVRIGLNTEYKVEKIQNDGGFTSWAFELVKGSIRGLIEKSPRKDFVKFKVYSPTGTMGVRGTEFIYSYDTKTKQTDLFTMSGTVWLGGRRADFSKPTAFTSVERGQRSYVRRSTAGEFMPTPAKQYQPEDLFKAIPRNQAGDEARAVNPEEKLKAVNDEVAQVKEKMALFEKMDKVNSTIKEGGGRNITVPNAKKILEKSAKDMSQRRDQVQSARAAGNTSGNIGNAVGARGAPSKVGISGGTVSQGTISTPRGGVTPMRSATQERATTTSSGAAAQTSAATQTTGATQAPAVRPTISATAGEEAGALMNRVQTQGQAAAETAVVAEPHGAPPLIRREAGQETPATVSDFRNNNARTDSLQRPGVDRDEAPLGRGAGGTAASAPPNAGKDSVPSQTSVAQPSATQPQPATQNNTRAATVGAAIVKVITKAVENKKSVEDGKNSGRTSDATKKEAAKNQNVDLEKSAELMLGGVNSKKSAAQPSSKVGQDSVAKPVTIREKKTAAPVLFKYSKGGAASTR